MSWCAWFAWFAWFANGCTKWYRFCSCLVRCLVQFSSHLPYPQGSGCHIHIDRLEPIQDFGGEDWMAEKKPWAASVVIKCPWNRRSIMNHYESNSIRMVKNVECTGGWPTSWTSFQDFHSANPPEVKSQTFSVKPWATRWSSNLFVQVSHPYVIPWGEEHQSTLAASSTQHNTTTKGVNMSYHPPISRHDNLWQPYMYVIIHIRSYPVTSKSDTWSPRMGSKPVILDDSAWQETCCGELCPNCRSLAQCWRQNNCHMKPYLLRQSLFQAWVEV